jgi:steroid 5-alpha reductase family enzyme
MTFEIINYYWITIAFSVLGTLIIFNIRAPYGRHSSKKWGPMIDNKWGWVSMESPALLIMPLLSFFGPAPKTNLTYLLVGLWCFHYIYRTLVFPFKLKTINKKMPVIIVISAVFFNGVNGFLNGYFLGYINTYSIDINAYHVYIGFSLFLTGIYINRSSDRTLISLREKQDGYQIPNGRLFDKISCPNHFGEIIEWIGFAILAWNISALSFAIWTACNLIPRALNHHSWYNEYFEAYPQKRKAIIPYIL